MSASSTASAPVSDDPPPASALTPRTQLLAGVRAILPLIPGVIPFALVSAYAAREAGLTVAEALGLSTIVFAGAAQMAFVSLLASGAIAPVILLTVLVINLRMVMYSASLAPHLHREPAWRRLLMGYLLTDQAFAVSITRFTEAQTQPHKGWFYLGSAAPLWIVWQIFTLAGLLLGARVPPGWGLEFTVPLVFLVLLVPAIRDRPSAEAALVGGGGGDRPCGHALQLGTDRRRRGGDRLGCPGRGAA